MAQLKQKYHFIYKTTCLITGRYYIGMHSTPKIEDSYLGSGKKLWHSINYHGKENHAREILEFLPDRKSLANRERELVNEDLLSDSLCMNLVKGGEGWHGFTSAEHQLKCSTAGGNSNNPTKSRLASERLTAELKKRQLNGTFKTWDSNYSWIGKLHKEETKVKIGLANSIKQLGEKNSQFGTKWMIHPINGPIKVKLVDIHTYLSNGYVFGRGKLHKEETKVKIGLANSIKQLGEKNSQFGTKWMIHPINGPIKVKLVNIPTYLSNGYVLGKKLVC